MSDLTKNKKKFTLSTQMILLITYIVGVIIFAILSPYFFTVENFLKIGLYAAQMGVLSAGMTFVMICGGMDISIGSVMALVGIVCSMMLKGGVNVVLVVVAGILLGTMCGVVNGLIITKGHVVPMIATLGTMTIFRGSAQIISDGQMIAISNKVFNAIGRMYVGGVMPLALIIMIIVYVIAWWILKYTYFGVQVYSVGGNAKATFLSGVDVNKIRLGVYTICGTTAGIAGITLASQSGAGLPNAAADINMDVIAAVVLGGTSLSGGKGKVIGTVLGVAILSTLSNGMNMLAVPSFYQSVIRGIVLILAVVGDVFRGGEREI